MMISIMVPAKLGWIGLVLSTGNQFCNPEFVQLPSWYRPLVGFKKILSSFTHPQVVANLYEFLSSAEHKGR